MFKKLLFFSLFIVHTATPMQRLNPFSNPLSNIGLNTETNETLKEVALNATSTAKEVSKGFAALSEGLSDSTAHITQALNGTSQNLTKALVGTSNHLEKTITISSAEVCRTVTHATNQFTNTANKLIDTAIPALNQNVNALVQNGVRARLVIDPTTIKTLCFAGTGTALALAGIGLILYESFFAEDYAIEETPQSTTWNATIKNFVKNRYVLGSASIAAGLCLIAKSTTL